MKLEEKCVAGFTEGEKRMKLSMRDSLFQCNFNSILFLPSAPRIVIWLESSELEVVILINKIRIPSAYQSKLHFWSNLSGNILRVIWENRWNSTFTDHGSKLSCSLFIQLGEQPGFKDVYMPFRRNICILLGLSTYVNVIKSTF